MHTLIKLCLIEYAVYYYELFIVVVIEVAERVQRKYVQEH